MKRTMRKDLLRAITKSVGRFFSIFLIVALGCGFFAGIKATGPDMRETADKYYDDTKLMDLHLMSELGFSQANADAIAETPGVSEVMPSYQTTLNTQSNSENQTIRVQSFSGIQGGPSLNQLTVVDGRLPENTNECVIEQKAIAQAEFSIGQQITLFSTDPSAPSLLTTNTFTIVGTVDTPKAINAMASSSSLGSHEPDYNVFVLSDAFSTDIYTDIYITISGAQELVCYDDAYSDRVQEVLSEVQRTGGVQSQVRRTEIIDAKTIELTQALSGNPTQLSEALASLSVIENQWYYLDRSTNSGYTSLKDDSARIDAISTVFPVFFFLVAALVSLTTMTRMVDEERMQIGSLKSLGYSRSAIAMKYTSYAALASTFGAIFGLLIGFQMFPRVIYNAYMILYRLPPIHPPFRPALAWVTLTAAVLCTTIAALFAILSSLHSSPATLMRPKAPQIGKRVLLERIPVIWNHMGFIKKITARNLFRYKKRFLMTVVGIAGCTALILSGFGLKNSVTGLVDRQFGEVMQYDLQIMLSSPIEDPDADATFAWLRDAPEIKSETPLYANTVDVISSKAKSDLQATLLVPRNTKDFADYVSLHERVGNKVLDLSDEGVIISEKLARMKHVEVGDSITMNGDGQESVQVTISGICENYTFHYIYMSPTLFDELYGQPAPVNTVFALLKDPSEDAINAFQDEISEQSNIAGTLFIPFLKEDLGKVFVSLNYVIAVLIMSAFALAVVVLYNLTNININERVREIATIKVLGFYDMEVSAYVFRENAVITILGAGLGLGLGTILHSFIIQTAEIDTMMFLRDVLPASYLFSFALTLLFSLLVNSVMHFYLRRISMVESLKSVE